MTDAHLKLVQNNTGAFERLFTAGFRDALVPVIPIDAKLVAGSRIDPAKLGKVPGEFTPNGWHGCRTMPRIKTLAEAREYDRRTPSIGLATDKFATFDPDIESDDELAAIVRTAIETHCGPGIVRKGRRAAGLMYRLAPADDPIGKLALRVLKPGLDVETSELLDDAVLNRPQLIELLNAANWHVNIGGPHPGGGQYACAPPVAEWKPESFRTVTSAQLMQAWAAIEKAALDAGYEVIDRDSKRQHTVGTFPDQRKLLAADLDELREILFKIPNVKGRTRWVEILHAIKAAGGDSAETLELALDWCRRREDGDPYEDEAERVFTGAGRLDDLQFRRGIGWLAELAGDVDAGNLIANRNAALDFDTDADLTVVRPVMSLQQMLRELVLIEDGKFIAMLSKPELMWNWDSALAAFRASVTVARAGPVLTLNIWLAHRERLSCWSPTFSAGDPEICTDEHGRTALNRWRPLPLLDPGGASPRLFLDHVGFLLPDAAAREHFLDWLAHIEQKPGELPHHGILMFTRTTGTGRNWIAEVLRRVWPGLVASGFHFGALIAKDNAFNNEIAGKLLAIADEVREGGRQAYTVNENFKQLVTQSTRWINPKFGRKYQEKNALRWLLFSNHVDALPLRDTDRRVYVMANPSTVHEGGKSYYGALYNALSDVHFIAAVRMWLRERNVSDFNPGAPPPMNDAKGSDDRGREE